MTSNDQSKQYEPPQAMVNSGARISPAANISPFACIHEDVEIGAGTSIGSHVVIYPGVTIGENCKIYPGTVISPEVQDLEFWRTSESNSDIRPAIRIGNGVHLEPNVIIRGGVVIGDGSWIGANVTILDGARIGRGVKIFPSAVIAGIPQDLKFEGEKTTVEIGDDTVIREFVSIHRGTTYHGKTVVGKKCLLMAYVHVAHDCILGDNVIISNAVNMAGHVEVDDFAIISGTAAIHQFVKIGKHAFVAGGSLVRKDVPPFVKAGRSPVKYEGVNSIGLRRRNYPNERIHNIQDIYRYLFLSGMNTARALDHIEAHLPATEERDEIITFVRNATRGIIKGHNSGQIGNAAEAGE